MSFHDIEYGAVTVLAAANGGAYPFGNTALIRGSGGSLMIDPSRALTHEAPSPDAVFLSHAHEDHLAGLRLFEVPLYAHAGDVAGVRDVQVLLDGFGLPPGAREEFAATIDSEFGLKDRPDAVAVEDGHTFHLGDRTATVVHLPGHTAGHCGLVVEPDGFFFIGDIDLTSFGPFYGDVGSSLTDYEASVTRVAEIDARWYATFHQRGVVEGRTDFLARLQKYRAVIDDRDERILALLVEPMSIGGIVENRVVYRKHVKAPYVEHVERRTAERHLARLCESGAVVELSPGLFRAAR